MFYNLANFLAEHPIILAGVAAALVILGGAMPYIANFLRPTEYVFVAWVDMEDLSVLNHHRYEWKHGDTQAAFPIPDAPVPLPADGLAVAFIYPLSWGFLGTMTIVGMEPGSRYVSPQFILNPQKMGGSSSGYIFNMTVASKLKEEKGDIEYAWQGIDWLNTIPKVDALRVLIDRNDKYPIPAVRLGSG